MASNRCFQNSTAAVLKPAARLDEEGKRRAARSMIIHQMHELTDISKLHSTVNYFLPKHVVFSLVITEHLEFGKLLIDIRCLEICWLN